MSFLAQQHLHVVVQHVGGIQGTTVMHDVVLAQVNAKLLHDLHPELGKSRCLLLHVHGMTLPVQLDAHVHGQGLNDVRLRDVLM